MVDIRSSGPLFEKIPDLHEQFFLCGRLGGSGSGFFPDGHRLGLVDRFHDEEHDEGNDDEIDADRDEIPVGNHRTLLLEAANRSPRLKTMMKKTEEDLKLNPNDDDMQRFSMDVTYSMEKAASFGYVPEVSVDDGIALSIEWAKSLQLVA